MTAPRTALVTGAGAGMGKATAERLGRDGFAVGVLDIDGATALETAEAIASAGGKAIALAADVGDRAQVGGAVAQLRDAFGPVTALINNAAVENFCPVEQLDDATWDRLMAINLKGALHTIQALLPDMQAAGWGRIVNISAIGAQTGAPNMALYTATKGGIIALTRSLAIDPHGKCISGLILDLELPVP